jgi:hypothetical protein
MPHAAKSWKNDPDSGVDPMGTDTPVDAAGLIDLETRVGDSIDASLVEHGAPLAFTISGALSVGPRPIPMPVLRAGKITAVASSIGVTPVGGRVVADIHLNGTTIFTNQANRPTVMAGESVSEVTTPDIQDVVPGDVLTFHVDEIGVAVPLLVQELVPTGTTTHVYDIAGASIPVDSGDLLIYVGRTAYISGSPAVLTTPGGWAELTQINSSAGAQTVERHWREHDTVNTTYQFSIPGTTGHTSRMWHFKNHLPVTPIDVVGNSTPGFAATGVLPSLIPTADSELYFGTAHFQTSRTVTIPPADMTLVRPASNDTATTYWAWKRVLGELGVASGTRTATFSASDQRIVQALTIKGDPAAEDVEKGSDLAIFFSLG